MKLSKTQAVPLQKEGQQVDITEKMEAFDTTEAKLLFAEAKSRLFNISDWESISEGISASFTLTDRFGQIKNGLPAVGDHVRINIPGPGSSAGGGYDWVRIELIQEGEESDQEFAIIKVRPSADPAKQEGIAHFFDSGATSSFIVKRVGRILYAEIHGRNEKPNTENKKLPDKIRNFVVSTAATIGIATIQWQKLAKGLLNFQPTRS